MWMPDEVKEKTEKVSCSIKIRKSTKELLDKAKRHPRETYDEVIRRLLEGMKG